MAIYYEEYGPTHMIGFSHVSLAPYASRYTRIKAEYIYKVVTLVTIHTIALGGVRPFFSILDYRRGSCYAVCTYFSYKCVPSGPVKYSMNLKTRVVLLERDT